MKQSHQYLIFYTIALYIFLLTNVFADPLLPDGFQVKKDFFPGVGKRIGKVNYVQGKVYITHDIMREGFQAKKGIPLYAKDTIYVMDMSRVNFEFNDKSILTLGSNTKLKLKRIDYVPNKKHRVSYLKMYIGKGRFRVKDYKHFKNSKFSVKTPNALIGVRGSDFIIRATLSKTRVETLKDTKLLLFSDAAQDYPAFLNEFEWAIVEQDMFPSDVEPLPPESQEEINKEFSVESDGKDINVSNDSSIVVIQSKEKNDSENKQINESDNEQQSAKDNKSKQIDDKTSMTTVKSDQESDQNINQDSDETVEEETEETEETEEDQSLGEETEETEETEEDQNLGEETEETQKGQILENETKDNESMESVEDETEKQITNDSSSDTTVQLESDNSQPDLDSIEQNSEQQLQDNNSSSDAQVIDQEANETTFDNIETIVVVETPSIDDSIETITVPTVDQPIVTINDTISEEIDNETETQNDVTEEQKENISKMPWFPNPPP